MACSALSLMCTPLEQSHTHAQPGINWDNFVLSLTLPQGLITDNYLTLFAKMPSATGRDLRAIFALLRKDSSGRVPSHAVLLLQSLAVMAQHQGPTTFFDFANEGAGIVRNTPLRFPGAQALSISNQGDLRYTFCSWSNEYILVSTFTNGEPSFPCASFLAHSLEE